MCRGISKKAMHSTRCYLLNEEWSRANRGETQGDALMISRYFPITRYGAKASPQSTLRFSLGKEMHNKVIRDEQGRVGTA